jgi:hypothetical protein
LEQDADPLLLAGIARDAGQGVSFRIHKERCDMQVLIRPSWVRLVAVQDERRVIGLRMSNELAHGDVAMTARYESVFILRHAA